MSRITQNYDYHVSSPFGMRTITVSGKTTTSMHNGIDLSILVSADRSDWLKAHTGGTVYKVGYDANGWGNYVQVLCANGWVYMYAHMMSGSIKVSQGQGIPQGTIIGKIGSTGKSTGNHVHFQVWSDRNGTVVNPTEYLEKDFPGMVNLLLEDGEWGTKTTLRLQQYFGTTQDGIISKPSDVIKAIQRAVGATPDGYLGPDTISKMQIHFGTPVDGIISHPSLMVKAMQKALNNNTF